MELLSSLRRRWILASVLLFLTLAGTAFAFVNLPSTYKAGSSIVFLAPTKVAQSFGGNPFLAFNTALNQTADVVRYGTMDVRTVNLLAARGFTSTYLVIDATDTAGPVLTVTVTGHNKASVERTLGGVTSEIGRQLNSLQAGLTPGNKIQDLVITYTPKATVVASRKARPLSVVAGLGLVLTLGIPFIVDAVLLRRRSRQEPLALENDNDDDQDYPLIDLDRRISRYPVRAANGRAVSQAPVRPLNGRVTSNQPANGNLRRNAAAPRKRKIIGR